MQRLMVQYAAQTIHRRLFDMYVQFTSGKRPPYEKIKRSARHTTTSSSEFGYPLAISTRATGSTLPLVRARRRLTNDTHTRRRRSLLDGIVTVCQRVHAVVQYIPLVVEHA